MIRAFLTGAVLALMLEGVVDWIDPLPSLAMPSARAFALRAEPVPVSSASPLQSLSQGEH
jgi:hypothetical protein